MDERQLTKTIGYTVLVIIGYHIIGVFIPMLTYAVIAFIFYRIVTLYLNNKQ